jgi:hypothetical protein
MPVPEVQPVEPTQALVKPEVAEISPSPAPGLAALHITGNNWEAGVYEILFLIALAASLVGGYINVFGNKNDRFDARTLAHFASSACFLGFNMAAWLSMG